MKKKILVTGGAGFVGSNLCEDWQKMKTMMFTRWIIISLVVTKIMSIMLPIEGNTSDINDLVHFYPDLIFHLGEYSRLNKSFDDIEKYGDIIRMEFFCFRIC